MLAIFKKGTVNPPQELHSPSSLVSSKKAKIPSEIFSQFSSSQTSTASSFNFGDSAFLAFATGHDRMFCGLDNIYCSFMGRLNNLHSLNRQYGLSKATNEAMFVVEAYRTLRDRGPYPAHEVLKGLDGNFGFVVYDSMAGTVFAAQGANEVERMLFWGIAADGSLVISDNLEVIKGGCAKSFAPFPNGCMFHSEQGVMSFEHPTRKMKAMPRIDSEGVMCGANFKVDDHSRITSMPRVGSEVNCAVWGSH
ncbi:stem-specific protein TSJT1-like [Rutidosis leptorrhynchoides]|uniref:stem-specific protein TSJT1-like n=1 Tax=Rutidosis leptorrhynchoides TaxID=125765 RepID=UPI003A99D59B